MSTTPEEKPSILNQASQPVGADRKNRTTIPDTLMDKLIDYINSADEQAAAEGVQQLRQKMPEATTAQLVDALIQRKCLKTGSVGAVTSGAALIPGLGTLASLTFGVAADISVTFKLQTELVLEIAAAYARELSPTEKRCVILLVTGISTGANQVLSRAGAKIAQKATERLVQRSIVKAIPVLGVAASAGVNVLSTYIIGRRAQAYFGLGEAQMDDWAESVRAITGLDERKIAGWLSEATWESWDLINHGVKGARSAARSVGEATGSLLLDAGRGLVGWGKWAGDTTWAAGEKGSDYLRWWQRDEEGEPKFLSDEEQSIQVAERQPHPIRERVVAVIGTAEQSPEEAQTQIQEAQMRGETKPGTERSIFRSLNPRNWFERERGSRAHGDDAR